MSQNIFLQEMKATVAFFDMREFSNMCSRMGPLDLGVALGRYYQHVEDQIREHQGRLIKFISDAVLVFFPSAGDADHAGNALTMVQTLLERAPLWSAESVREGLPPMTYSIGLATGTVLHGDVGTNRQRVFDVLGQPVTLAKRLARLATVRGTPHLVTASCVWASGTAIPTIEVEGAEFGKEPIRLYRALTTQEIIKQESTKE